MANHTLMVHVRRVEDGNTRGEELRYSLKALLKDDHRDVKDPQSNHLSWAAFEKELAEDDRVSFDEANDHVRCITRESTWMTVRTERQWQSVVDEQIS